MNKDIKIRDYLINTISDNKEGEKLPSENKIARDFGVSRHKVRSIYDSLEAMGLVYSVQGVGRFAHVNLKEVSLALNSKSFTDKMASDGGRLNLRVSPEEKEMIRHKAEAENMTMSALVRRSLEKVDKPITVNLDASDLRDLVIQSRRIDSTVRTFLKNMDILEIIFF